MTLAAVVAQYGAFTTPLAILWALCLAVAIWRQPAAEAHVSRPGLDPMSHPAFTPQSRTPTDAPWLSWGVSCTAADYRRDRLLFERFALCQSHALGCGGPGRAALDRRRVHGRRRRQTAGVGVLGHGEPDRAAGDRRRQHRGVDGFGNRRRARPPHARVHLRPGGNRDQ